MGKMILAFIGKGIQVFKMARTSILSEIILMLEKNLYSKRDYCLDCKLLLTTNI